MDEILARDTDGFPLENAFIPEALKLFVQEYTLVDPLTRKGFAALKSRMVKKLE